MRTRLSCYGYRNFEAVPMSLDHKPSREDESKRIREAGGFVINNRVMGELAVSRAFGDSEFKKGIKVLRNTSLICFIGSLNVHFCVI